MKVLILNGSPRRTGNTALALAEMKNTLSQKHEVELLSLCEMKLSGCRACDGCKKNGGHCVCPDDSDLLITKIAQADAVIFGSPVYWWGISAQLKMVIDKFYAQDAQFKEMKKKIGVLAVGANSLENPQYRLIREQFECIAAYLHWKLAFSLSFSAWMPGELMQQDTVCRQLKEACEKI